ncbi:CBS domain-containing protein [Sinorhizobium medicae]|uniref:site-2 protease family protein n=1 Tax=Sinorhizobium medicae TaxID=110321 RepID=UPI000C7D1158|nr:site-2 protease family protein [Sinorhizobium medicae]PLU48530.1 site-2 protease family protein [Sinorhizobium medicae]RVQ45835.1 CBS domain-containing protein [Sinorhizobium medicae]
MGWSLKLGTIAGTEIRIHMTFVLLLVWIWFTHYQIGGAPAAWEGVAFILSVFVCVVLHEFGHIAAARRFGIKTPDITLLPIGGVARLERNPSGPTEELLIAIAGPLVNIVIAALLLAVIGGVAGLEELARPQDPQIDFFVRLVGVNIFLVLFNMIPAFPMDGGRVLRAILAWRWSWERATRVAATIGQGAAFVMGVAGVFYSPLLILVAIFVYLAAEAEAQSSELQAISGGVTVGDVMLTEFGVLQSDARLSEAAELLLATSQNEYPVVDGEGKFAGLLTRDGIIGAMKEGGPNALVRTVMRTDIPWVYEETGLGDSLRVMQTTGAPAAAVVSRSQHPVGIMNYETVGEMLMLRATFHDFRFGMLRRSRAGSHG